MKKILLLLNLIAFTAISQVTPVGGYLPLNSSKSFTAGNATCSNVIARGTFSVGSTATVSGSAFMNEDIRLTQGVAFDASKSGRIYYSSSQGLSFQGRTGSLTDMAFFTPTGTGLFKNPTGTTNMHLAESGSLSVGANTTPSACLHVFGNAKVSSTFSLGSANLTGGNTGTVAVLSDVISHIDNYVISSAIADASMYYFSHVPFGITTVNSKLKISGNWTIYQYQFEAWCNGATSSAETCTLNYQIGTATTTVRSDVTFTVSGANTYTGTLNVNLNDGDLFNSQIITPTFATNPTNTAVNMTYWIRRRT